MRTKNELIQELKNISEEIINCLELTDSMETDEAIEIWKSLDSEILKVLVEAKKVGLTRDEIETHLYYTHLNLLKIVETVQKIQTKLAKI